MRLIAGLCWYQESPTFLAATVASLAKIGVDHLVALDGAYMLFPQGKGNSGIFQSEAVSRTAEAVGIGLTLHTMPTHRKYVGGEVEKRNLLFKFVSAQAEEGDWYFSIDADEVVTSVQIDVKAALEATDLDAATCTLSEPVDPQADEMSAMLARHFPSANGDYRSPARRFFRILAGFRVGSNHYTYLAGYGEDEKILWCPHQAMYLEQVPDLDLQGTVVIEHRDKLRDKTRLDQKWVYYNARDAAGIEPMHQKGSNEIKNS